MDMDMIGVPVTTIAVIGDQEFGALFGKNGSEVVGSGIDRGGTERAGRPLAIGIGLVAGVGIVEEDDAGGTDGRSGGFGFEASALGKRLVSGEDAVSYVAGTAARSEDEDHAMTGLSGSGERAGIEKGFVIGMGMKGDHGPGRHLSILTGQRRGLP